MEKSPLSKLAAELRNNIYERALYFHRPFRITADSCSGKLRYEQADGSGSKHQATALLQVCKQVRSECSQLFYACNKFVIAYDNDTPQEERDELCILRRFKASIGDMNSAVIPRLDVDIYRFNIESPLRDAIELLDRLPGFEASARQHPFCELNVGIMLDWPDTSRSFWQSRNHCPFSYTFDMRPDSYKMSRGIARVLLEEEMDRIGSRSGTKFRTLQVFWRWLASYGEEVSLRRWYIRGFQSEEHYLRSLAYGHRLGA